MKKLMIRLAGTGAVAAAVVGLAGGVASASSGDYGYSHNSSYQSSERYSSYEKQVDYSNYNSSYYQPVYYDCNCGCYQHKHHKDKGNVYYGNMMYY